MLNTNLPMAVGIFLPNHRETVVKMRMVVRSDCPDLEKITEILDTLVETNGERSILTSNDNFEAPLFEERCQYNYQEAQDLAERLERRKTSVEGLIAILTDIELFSRPRPVSLLHFAKQLVQLLDNDSHQVLYKTHNLLDRLIKNCPGSLSIFFDEWLSSFRKHLLLTTTPPTTDILNLYLPEAFDMCSVFPERSLEITEVLFELLACGRSIQTDTLMRCIRELSCETMFTNH